MGDNTEMGTLAVTENCTPNSRKRRARKPSARPGRRRRTRLRMRRAPGKQRPKRVRPPRAVVLQVDPQSAAERAGLKPGDLVTELDGTPVRDAADLRLVRALGTHVWTLLTVLSDIWAIGHTGMSGGL